MIRSWCPDRVLPQALKYISESMGVKYAEGVILNLEEMWEESNKRIPMVCFLSMGSDPTNSIESLSKKHNFSKCYMYVHGRYNESCVHCIVSRVDLHLICLFLYSFWLCVYGSRSRGSCQETYWTMSTKCNCTVAKVHLC